MALKGKAKTVFNAILVTTAFVTICCIIWRSYVQRPKGKGLVDDMLINKLPKIMAEPVLPMIIAEPVLPMTKAEPVLPMTNAEPVLPMIKAEPVLPKITAEPVLPKIRAELVLPISNAEPVLPMAKAEPVLPMIKAEPMLPMIKAEPVLPMIKAEPELPRNIDEPVLPQIFDIGSKSKPIPDITRDNGGHVFSERFRYLDKILQDCGELCNTSRDGIPGPFFNHVKANIQCDRLFRNMDIDRGHGETHAPEDIPAELMKEFTMDGRIKVTKYYFSQKFLGGKAKIWTKESIERNIDLAKKGMLRGTYNISETNALRDGLKHAPHIKNGRVLVIGSQNPWVEACVLEAGAREVVTLEYRKIISQFAKVRTMVPSEFRLSYFKRTLGLFDGVVTFSSVEHSGLGRYGDAFNPWGDILAIAKAWCVTRYGGSLTIGVPYNGVEESLYFNAHRFYGKIRYPYLTTNWHQYYQGQGQQRVFVFTK